MKGGNFMKKYFSILMTFLLVVGMMSSSISVSAASKTYYYPVEGTSSIAPGIYKGTVNGNGKAILKNKVYKKKDLSKPPIKIDSLYTISGKGSVAKKADYKNTYNLITLPIQDVQVKGKDLYYTKYLFEAVYYGYACGGGGANILEIYKRNSKGKSTKVVNDKVSSNTIRSFYVKDKYIYYAKVNKDPLGNYTIVRTTLDGKKKTTLKKSVDDFWVSGKYIYYTSKNKLYRMDLKGKNSKKFTNIKVELYGNSPCEGSNYSTTFNGEAVSGLVTFDYTKNKEVYFDFSTGKTTNITPSSVSTILSVDVKKKRFIGLEYTGQKVIVGLYDFKGKRIKKSKVTFKDKVNIVSVSAKNNELIYVSGTKLKKIKF